MSDNNNSVYMQDDDNNSNFNTVKWIAVDGERQLATLNLVEGNSVYGEKLLGHKGGEYRIWDPFRSKLAAALKRV